MHLCNEPTNGNSHATNCIQMLHKFANSICNCCCSTWSRSFTQCNGDGCLLMWDLDKAHRTTNQAIISPEIVTLPIESDFDRDEDDLIWMCDFWICCCYSLCFFRRYLCSSLTEISQSIWLQHIFTHKWLDKWSSCKQILLIFERLIEYH